MNNQRMRRLDDLSDAEQIEVLTKIKNFLTDCLCASLMGEEMPTVAQSTAPQSETLELETAAVVAQAEALLL